MMDDWRRNRIYNFADGFGRQEGDFITKQSFLLGFYVQMLEIRKILKNTEKRNFSKYLEKGI